MVHVCTLLVWLVCVWLVVYTDDQQASIAVAQLGVVACCKAQVLGRVHIHDLGGISKVRAVCQLLRQAGVRMLGVFQLAKQAHRLDDWFVVPLARALPHHVQWLVWIRHFGLVWFEWLGLVRMVWFGLVVLCNCVHHMIVI